MPKRKITAELWQQMLAAYEAWSPADPDAGSIDDVLRPFGVSRQAFYAELRRQGIAPKATATRPRPAGSGLSPEQHDEVVAVLLQTLVETRHKITLLEAQLEELRAQLSDKSRRR